MGFHTTTRSGSFVVKAVLAGLCFSQLFISGVYAQTVLTLQDAINIALEKSYSMKQLRLQLTQAEQNLISARNSFRTNVRMALDSPIWSEQVSAVQVANALPVYNSTGSLQYHGGLTIRQPLPTDGTVTFTSNLTQSNVSTYLTQTQNTLKRADFISSFRLQLNQPLFTLNRIQLNLKNAQLGYELTFRQRTRQQLDVIYNVTSSFYDFYRNIRTAEISKETFDQQQKAYDTSKQKFEAGLIPEVEALQMEVDLAEANDNLLSNQAALTRQIESFKQLIGVDPKEDITVKADLTINHFDIDLNKAITEGLKNRSEVREGEISIEQGKMNIRDIASNNQINGVVSAFYDFSGVSDSSLPFSTGPGDLFNSSWDDMQRRPRNRGVTFTLNVPIWDWGVNEARVTSAQAQLQNTQLRLEDTKKTIERGIKDSVSRVRDAESRIQILQKRQEIAQKSYDISLERFNIGEIKADDLAQDRNRLNSAKMAYLGAYISYQLAAADLKRNTLFDFETGKPVQ
ncbi:MAG: TolC family protein [Candidatus Latescibacter sp.]|nr:TolC family protein [Candidatus Latescibacter sp.]